MIRALTIALLLGLASIGYAQQPEPPKPAETAQRLVGLESQLQQALGRIAVLERRVGAETERQRQRVTRSAYVLACKQRGMRFDRLSLNQDGKESILCR